MPNLTSYHAPAIHLNRELPKSYCDLIEHEWQYIHFLRSRLMNIESSLASTNPKPCLPRIPQDHSEGDPLAKTYQKVPADCLEKKGKNRVDISHFRLRQKRWKEKVDHENQRFIRSMIDRRAKYRPPHDRYAAQESFEKHLKSLQMMSDYSKSNRTNPICQKFLRSLRLNPSKTHRPMQINRYSRRSISYIENMLQQTTNQAVDIYNQPLPSPPNRIRTAYSEINQRIKPSLYHRQRLFQSIYGVHSLDLGPPQTGRGDDGKVIV